MPHDPTNQNFITPFGGRAQVLVNRSGGAIRVGEVVELNAAGERGFAKATAGSANPLGVAYENVVDGSECWVVTEGPQDVLLDSSGGCSYGQPLCMSPTEAGRVRVGAVGVPFGTAIDTANAGAPAFAFVKTTQTLGSDSAWINVVDFGAIGDGVTDDTAAFAAAIAVANGETILVPAGTYVLDNLPVNVATHLWLNDAATLLHKPNGSAQMIAFAASELVIQGGTIDGNRLNNLLNWPSIISGTLQQGRKIHVRDVNVTGTVGNFIYTWNFGGVLEVEYCTFTNQQESDGTAAHTTMIIDVNSGQAGVKGFIRFNFNRAVANTPATVDGVSPGGVFVATCPPGMLASPGNFSTFEAIGNEFYGYGQNMAASPVAAFHLYKDVGGARIIGNYFEQSAICAIYAKSVTDFVCSGNVILNGQVTSENIVSDGAIAYAPGFNAAAVSHPRATISNNIVDAPGALITNIASAIVETGDVASELSGYDGMTGLTSFNTNAGTLYFSVVADGGGFFHIGVYKDAARTQLVAHTASYNGAGNKPLVADGASGLGGTVSADLVGPANAGITVQCIVKQPCISVHGIPTSRATDVVVSENVLNDGGWGVWADYLTDLTVNGGVIRCASGGAAGREGGIQINHANGNVLIEGVEIFSANGHGIECDVDSAAARFSVSKSTFEHTGVGTYACTLRGVAYAGFFGNTFNAPGLTAVSITWDGVNPTALLHWDGGNSLVAGALAFDWAHITAGTGYLSGAASPYGIVPAGAIGTLYQQTTGAQLWISNVASATGWARVKSCWMGSTTPSLGTINANTVSTFTIAVTGADVDVSSCAVASPVGNPGAGLVWSAHVTADNVVTVRVANPTLGNIVTSDVLWVASVSVLV